MRRLALSLQRERKVMRETSTKELFYVFCILVSKVLCGFGLLVENSALLIVLFPLLQSMFRYDVIRSSPRIIELLYDYLDQ